MQKVVLNELKSTVSNVYVNTKTLKFIGHYNITNISFQASTAGVVEMLSSELAHRVLTQNSTL
jgi:hypothetical protein